MKKLNKIRINFAERGTRRKVWVALWAAAAALLGAVLGTGHLNAQAGAGFHFLGALVRVITPNGDRANDLAIVCFDNPRFSGVSGDVFDLRGHQVSGMAHTDAAAIIAQCPPAPPGVPNTEALTWDGRSNGTPVSGGVYIYQIKSEDVVVTGTVLVVR
ncbi:MAG: hypothetical protein ABII00_13125 [Elusimicrobiota bacterium]